MISMLGVMARKRAYIYILDAVGVTPYAAYSTRKLSSTYAGSAIRVRRSSDNAEQDIGFAANKSLDTTSLLSFVGANSGYVVTWYDQSSNAFNMTKSTQSLQPRIVNAGVVETSNGHAAPYFNQSLLSSTNPGLTNQPFVRNYVFKNNSSPGPGNYAITISGSNGITYAPNYIYNGDTERYFAGTTEVNIATITSTDSSVWTVTYNGASSNGRQNGTTMVTADPGSTGLNGVEVGAYDNTPLYYTIGWLSEVVVYGTTLTTPQEQLLERNQGAYYGITVA